MTTIQVSSLMKTFNIYRKQPGIMGSLGSLIKRSYTTFTAVNDISFSIEEGELVGFIGPNGAGKTTTLKMLSGLLYPTSGKITVLGYTPFERKPEFLKKISLVMGQKNQLWWDLPPMESFLLNKEIYEVTNDRFKTVLSELTHLMGIEDILNVQVRNLSLGQRMKCELIAQLIHSPRILFLDEPTIGLDVVMQKKLRDFIREYNRQYKATVILTSHYMDDVKELCKRVIVIDHGKLLFDGQLDKVIKKYSRHKLLSIIFSDPPPIHELESLGQIILHEGQQIHLEIEREKSNEIAAHLLKTYAIADLNIEEPPIEEIIRSLFSEKK
ncbi:ABC transporter [Candidatus Roizmanbacteria bacterium RIFOXYB2_FULL_38_10]|uniref:ABC transporter n=1 Tax=Candidatus Roizmanbacteria bacterium RIFOXYD1_FULL_38_12 TaxID=1802093 RepID=A0A1F7L1I8_9BACT|nr:MAG: ABC transporter [Candidatus Roizmanbacteria bacterium RIFOXYA2_FULL_38_14]OGK63994.1 MAG: ABC transporter [Candidatus Roizmanbacteria bacterium RIFOXYA1_FULL_37_12]OGK65840.1 MAG: ABC transporter [Candidatus Roizmanbacteria bacterium RIFOXYB1_FULL_40_23]OGK68947.1 MAG: ABC transporter [Candidatus Roizmanbacteria bacterium RIFOXYB2_FULL_38_10]OGK70245.1 MAG: ABC transporter [Candidatus Roizmanbacteria bacterium RIFOXYC1_FULL_38_14]OGK73987.1 MAG: ABC transporter [Candidatus Roizmanbacte